MYSLFSTNFTLDHKHTLNHILKVQSSWSYSPVSACWLSPTLLLAPALSFSLSGLMRTHSFPPTLTCARVHVCTHTHTRVITIGSMEHTAKEEFTLLLLLKAIYYPGEGKKSFHYFSGELLHFDFNHFKLCNETESLKKKERKRREEKRKGRRREGGMKERKKGSL